MIKVNPRARTHRDTAGDPLDGLVNMFDVGIVLAVAFLLAALASLNLTDSFTKSGAQPPANSIPSSPGDVVGTVPPSVAPGAGEGTKVGTVYRTRDGRLIYVVPARTPSPSP